MYQSYRCENVWKENDGTDVWKENDGTDNNPKLDLDNINGLITILNQILIISMHIASLVKRPCYLLKLSSGNETMGVSRAFNSVQIWRNLPISNSKPDLHNINAHTKFDENPWIFTQVIIRKRKTDRRTDVRTTDGQTHARSMWNHNTPLRKCVERKWRRDR